MVKTARKHHKRILQQAHTVSYRTRTLTVFRQTLDHSDSRVKTIFCTG